MGTTKRRAAGSRAADDDPRRAEEDWRQVFDAVPDLIAILDWDHRIVEVNRALAQRLGRDPRDCAGRMCCELIHGLEAPPGFCPHAAVMRDGREHSAEVEEPRFGGVFEVSALPRFDRTGQLVGSVHVARDVTERKRAEERLRASEQRLLVALESAGVGIFDWDVPSGKVLYVSPYTPYGTGEVPYREVDAGQWSATTAADDIPRAQAETERALSGATDRFSHVVRRRLPPHRENEWFYLHSQGRVVARDQSGRATRVMGTFEDVTDKVRAEQVEREREAAHARETRAASLDVLASSLAHEVNQPLAALSAYAQAAARLLERGPAGHREAEEAMGRCVELAERAAEIVRRLRRLLRRAPPEREQVDVERVLAAVQALMDRQARAAGVEVEVETQDPLPLLVGDRVQVEQVLVNLVSNAVEAFSGTSDRPRTVTVRAQRVGDTVEIAVADNGPGFAAGADGRLFEPFFTTKATGTGLGLAISRSIAEAHGGRIRVDRSGPGGATLVLVLPLNSLEVDGGAR